VQAEETVLEQRQFKRMSEAAWKVRDHAHMFGTTKVGAAVTTTDGTIFAGCNVEHRFRSHDIHAEVNAIGSMVAAGHTDLIAVVVVAERERFTPCGACMDWIYQFGGPSCLIGFQSSPDAEITMFRADDLMPYYPT
jgi:cytidine deaminase